MHLRIRHRSASCRSLIAAILMALPLMAQGFQSSFSEEKVDRKRVPTSLHGQVSVDAPTGAVNIELPLGPGIGGRGVKFQPTLRGRVAPGIDLRTASAIAKADASMIAYEKAMGCVLMQREGWPDANAEIRFFQGYKFIQTSQDSFSLSPGYLELPVLECPQAGQLHLPSGEAVSLPFDSPGTLPGNVDPLALIRSFPGYEAGWSLASIGQQATFSCQVANGGQLVVGLSSASAPLLSLPYLTNRLLENRGSGSAVFNRTVEVPRRIVVIDKDTLYEYSYVSVRLIPLINWQLDYDPMLASYTGTSYNAHVADSPSLVRYRITSMMNRTGDRIDFEYEFQPQIPRNQSSIPYFGTPEYIATWKINGASQASIRINRDGCTYEGGTGPWPSFSFSGLSMNKSIPENRGSGVEIEGVLSHETADLVTGPWDRWSAFSLEKVQDANTGDFMRFTYGAGPAIPANTMIPWVMAAYNPSISNVLSTVEMPGRTMRFQWESYPYRRNSLDDGGSGWNGYKGLAAETFESSPTVHGSTCPPWNPPVVVGSCVAGVVRVDEILPNSPARTTLHHRRVPVPVYNTSLAWESTTFEDAIQQPDGQVTLIRFVEPLQGRDGGPSSALEEQYQAFAHLKHMVRETRTYACEQDWRADGSPFNAVGTKAYRLEFLDRLDIRSMGNPSGQITGVGMPYATRTRTWDGDAGTLAIDEQQDWTADAFSWASRVRTVLPWNPTDDLAFETLSLPLQSRSPEPYAGALSVQQTRQTFENHGDMYLFGLPVRKDTHRTDSSTLSEPSCDPPSETFVYESPMAGIYRLKQAATVPAGGPTRTLLYEYSGSSGIAALQPRSLTLTEPGANLSAQVGIDPFGYDAAGHLSSIRPTGGFLVSQVQDALGFVTSQTDANGLTVAFSRDGAGRITAIAPPLPELPTTIVYDPDALGYTLTHGSQYSRMRFNGLGKPILEVRQDLAGISSHRMWGYDSGARNTWITGWRAGGGDETRWASSLAPDDVITRTPMGQECAEWRTVMVDGIPQVQCVSWMTFYQDEHDYGNSTHFFYDGRGRLIQTVTPNGNGSTTAYQGLTRTLSSGLIWNPANNALEPGPSTTRSIFQLDVLGRLVSVVNPLDQPTTYRYDAGDRLSKVVQSNAAGTLSQTRVWSYDSRGRLTSLTQPESGTTTYSGFDINDVPWTTAYNSQVVRYVYDSLKRVKSALSDDGTVSQTLVYDEGGAPALANGKLTTATSGGITRSLGYTGAGGLNGRLATLAYALDGQTFVQGVGYDNYGNLASRKFPDGRMQIVSQDASKGLPIETRLDGLVVAGLSYWDTSWNLKKITWGSAASMSFTYGADQSRLAALSYFIPSQGDRGWTYTYDDADRLVSDGEDHYSYDPVGRLKTALVKDFGSAPGLFQAFDYDAFGNRIASSTASVANWSSGASIPASLSITSLLRAGLAQVAPNLAFNESSGALLKNQLPAFTADNVPTGAVYDAGGNGNLERLNKQLGSASPYVQMGYDALGRVIMLFDSERNVTEKYRYDEQGLRVAVEEYDGAVLRRVKYNIYNEQRQLTSQWVKE